jgi:cold-inducible RNA-binding protein
MNHITLAITIAVAILVVLLPLILLKRKGASSGSAANAQTQLYIGNLAYRVHERDLRKLFSEYGKIAQLRVVKDRRSGRSKGFGFVTFEKPKAAQAALVAHGQEVMGRNLVVRIAKPR